MKKKQVCSGGYLIMGDIRSNTVQNLQIKVIALPPKRHGRIKREIFASIVHTLVVIMSEICCTCYDNGSFTSPLLEFPEPETVNVQVETALDSKLEKLCSMHR